VQGSPSEPSRTAPATDPRTDPAADRRADERTTLRLASAATALALVAFTLPLGLLPPIVADLGAGDVGRSWILSSMSVGFAAALLVAGGLADDLGRRRVFLLGLAVFAAGAFVAAAAPGAFVLSVGRVVQGLGSSALLASSLALIAHAFPDGPERAHATGVWGAMIGAGIAIGPLAGALVGELASWRVAYVVLGVIAAGAMAPAGRRLVESRAANPRPVDTVGAVVLALALTALTAGVVQGNAAGWLAAFPVAAIAGAVALLVAFAAWERRRSAPLFDLALLRRPAFTGALLGSFALGVAVLAFMSYVMTFVHTALGAGLIAAALWGLPWSVLSFLVAMRSRAVAARLGPRARTTLGLALCAAGLLLMRGLGAGSGPAHLVPGLIVLGIGTGLLNAALAQAAVSVVPPSRSGMGAGANNTARYLGAALGVPLVIGVLRAGTSHRVGDGASAAAAAIGAMNDVLLVAAAVAALGALGCFALLRPSQPALAAPVAGAAD
jgi:MFS family permease